MPVSLAATISLLVSASGRAAQVGAAPGPRPARAVLTLDLDGCPAVPAADIRNLVDVELRNTMALTDAAGPQRESDAAPNGTTVLLTCDQLTAQIDVSDPVTGKALKRTIDLSATASVARAHLVALSVVELLSASWAELLSNPEPVVPAAGSPAAPDTRAAALEFVRGRSHEDRMPWIAIRVTASATASSFGGRAPNTGPRLWGGALTVADGGPRHIGWVADLSFEHGDRRFSIGRVSTDSLSGLVGIVGQASRGRLDARGGVGARVGIAWLSGTPGDPDTAVGGTVRGSWWGPAVLVDSGVRLGRRAVVRLGLEGGRVLRPVTAIVQGESAVAIGGIWWRSALGVGFAL